MNNRILISLYLLTAVCLAEIEADYSGDINSIQKKINSQQSELSSLESEIKKYSDNLKVLNTRQNKLLQNLGDIDKNITEKRQELKELQEDIDDTEAGVSRLNEELKLEKKTGRKYNSYLKDSLKYYYFEKNRMKTLPWFAGFFTDIRNRCYIAREITGIPVQNIVYYPVNYLHFQAVLLPGRLQYKSGQVLHR